MRTFFQKKVDIRKKRDLPYLWDDTKSPKSLSTINSGKPQISAIFLRKMRTLVLPANLAEQIDLVIPLQFTFRQAVRKYFLTIPPLKEKFHK